MSARRVAAALALLALAATAARADGDEERFAPPSPVYRSECGSCHMAFPPELLSAASWRSLMGGLDKHFGTDASLDAKTAKEIGDYLAGRAGSARLTPVGQPRGEAPRISATRWFQREHDEVAAADWKNPAVKGAANCTACHRGAGEGDFEDAAIPRLVKNEKVKS